MELYIYDTEMTLLGVIDEITSLMWTRRYWSCGEFKLLIPQTERHSELIQNGRLIMRRDMDEAGQISYIHIQRDDNGLEQIEAQGRFLTHWIGNRIIEPGIVLAAPTQTILQTIVRDNLVSPSDSRRKIPRVEIADVGTLDSTAVNYASELFENALDACESRAKLAKLGFKITTDVAAKQHSFLVYKGLERTSNQTQNATCIFSTDFDSVLSQEFTASHENIASAVYVGGAQPQGEPRIWTEVSDDTRKGLDRIECVYDASDMQNAYYEDGVEHTIPLNSYLAMLAARGEAYLAGKVEYIAFTSKIDTRVFQYRSDFDVGDRVTCISRRWHVKVDVRITEATESFESGKVDIDVVFGESIPTLSEKIRWR